MHTQKPCSGGTIDLNHIVYISTTNPLNTLLWLLCILAFSLTSNLKWGSTNAGMDWNGMDYWNGLQGSNSQLLFFHTLSNRVSIASHTAMKMDGKNQWRDPV